MYYAIIGHLFQKYFILFSFHNFFKTTFKIYTSWFDEKKKIGLRNKFCNFFRKIFHTVFSFQDEIHVEENVPWGEDTLFTLEFREEANKYSIHTCNNMYLQRDGKLVPAVNKVGSKLFNSYIPKPFISKDFIGLKKNYWMFHLDIQIII